MGGGTVTNEALKEKYNISNDTVEMLRDYCDVETATNVDLIYAIASIKILQQRLIERGYTPNIDGCKVMVLKRTCDSIVEDALRSI